MLCEVFPGNMQDVNKILEESDAARCCVTKNIKSAYLDLDAANSLFAICTQFNFQLALLPQPPDIDQERRGCCSSNL